MKVEQLISDLESQLRRLKSMNLEGSVDVQFNLFHPDWYGGDILNVEDIEILFDKREGNTILVDVLYERKSWFG